MGAAALGASGRIYIGFNIEFENRALHHTVHAEQTLVALAMGQQETQLLAMAVSSAPCGHCRQFLSEVYKCRTIVVNIRDHGSMTLSDLLPHPFGPEDLNLKVNLFNSPRWNLHLAESEGDEVITAALEAASLSYAPYSNCPAGVALETRQGQIFAGSYAENAAFNPSLPPFQAALTHLMAHHADPSSVRRCVLVQAASQVNLENPTRSILGVIAKHVTVEAFQATLGPA